MDGRLGESQGRLHIPILGCLSGLLALPPNNATLSWSGIVAYDSLIFILTFIKAARTFRQLRTPLLTVLIRDGFMYYAVMLVIAVGNLVALRALTASHELIESGFVVILRAAGSIIGSRLQMIMRDTVYNSSGQSFDLSDMSWRAQTGPNSTAGQVSMSNHVDSKHYYLESLPPRLPK